MQDERDREGQHPAGEPQPHPDTDPAAAGKAYDPATSGGRDTGQPAGTAGAPLPGKRAAEFGWGCIGFLLAVAALIAIVYAIWRG